MDINDILCIIYCVVVAGAFTYLNMSIGSKKEDKK